MITIKTKEEIEVIRQNGKIVAQTLDLLHKSTTPGISTIELNNLADTFIRDNGATPATFTKGFPKSICISINEEVVHGIPSDRKLEEGQILTFDVCISKNGFCADAAITVCVGNVSDSVKRLADVCNQSLEKGIEKAIVGNRINDISSAIYNYVRSNGFNVIRDYGGHGIGKELHEDPFVPNCWCSRRELGSSILEGMVFTIEPMICCGKRAVKTLDNGWTIVTKDGSLAAHCEHTIVIVDGKLEILTKL
jgi:methionyl aminopeptidase